MLPLPFMSFLRPLPHPRPSSINLLQRPLSTSPRHYRGAATLVSSQSTPSSVASAIKLSTQIHPAALPPLPYHVHRTASQKLPVYHLAKRGGNLHQTRIRKIQGNVDQLRQEIVATLALREDNVVINRLTGHIIIKGWHKDDIKRFLEERHF